MVGDFYSDKWKPHVDMFVYPWVQPNSIPNQTIIASPVSQAEFEALKKEVLDMKELLKRAIDYDKRNNEPHCEQEEKIALLKKMAELVGVSLEDVFK